MMMIMMMMMMMMMMFGDLHCDGGANQKSKDDDADDDDDAVDNTMMMKMMTTTTTTNDLPINKKISSDKKPLFSCSRRTKGISDKRPRCPEVRLGIRKPTSAHQEVRSLNDRDVQK